MVLRGPVGILAFQALANLADRTPGLALAEAQREALTLLAPSAAVDAVGELAAEHGLSLETEGPVGHLRPLLSVTAAGPGLSARRAHELKDALTVTGGEVRSTRALRPDGTAVEILLRLPVAVEGALRDAVRRRFPTFDIAFRRDGLARRAPGFVFFDIDSTLLDGEVIDELARTHGVFDAVAGVTKRAMAGTLRFEDSLRTRVSYLEGLAFDDAVATVRRMSLSEGAKETVTALKHAGAKVAALSGGFELAAGHLRELLGLDAAEANLLEVEGGKLTGRVVGPVMTPERKAERLVALATEAGVSIDRTAAMGDGANDQKMLAASGYGIGYRPKPVLAAAADAVVQRAGLHRVLYLFGWSTADVDSLLGRTSTVPPGEPSEPSAFQVA